MGEVIALSPEAKKAVRRAAERNVEANAWVVSSPVRPIRLADPPPTPEEPDAGHDAADE